MIVLVVDWSLSHLFYFRKSSRGREVRCVGQIRKVVFIMGKLLVVRRSEQRLHELLKISRLE